jgi:hypothetical protein
MKFILILMIYANANTTIVGVTTAEFDDLAACQFALNSSMSGWSIGIGYEKGGASTGMKNFVAGECVPKGTAPPVK